MTIFVSYYIPRVVASDQQTKNLIRALLALFPTSQRHLFHVANWRWDVVHLHELLAANYGVLLVDRLPRGSLYVAVCPAGEEPATPEPFDHVLYVYSDGRVLDAHAMRNVYLAESRRMLRRVIEKG